MRAQPIGFLPANRELYRTRDSADDNSAVHEVLFRSLPLAPSRIIAREIQLAITIPDISPPARLRVHRLI